MVEDHEYNAEFVIEDNISWLKTIFVKFHMLVIEDRKVKSPHKILHSAFPQRIFSLSTPETRVQKEKMGHTWEQKLRPK